MIELIQKENRFYASSRDVAEKFGKEHHNILKAIDRLQVSDSFGQVNFNAATYNDSQDKPRPMYLMTRDGFTMLAFGFTGKKAAEWKQLYIEAFNKMEASLKQQKAVTSKMADALGTLEGYKQIAEFFKTPEHLYLSEAVKYIETEYGLDLTPMLVSSPAMDKIPDEEIYLEPNELAKATGLFRSGAHFNQFLEQEKLQVKNDKLWEPTFEAAGMCYKHAWKNGSKTGYNLKWNVEKIKDLVA